MNLLCIVEGGCTWIHRLSENWQSSRLMVSIIVTVWGDLHQRPASNCHSRGPITSPTAASWIIMTPAELTELLFNYFFFFISWINRRGDINATSKSFRLINLFFTLNRCNSLFADTEALRRDCVRNTSVCITSRCYTRRQKSATCTPLS